MQRDWALALPVCIQLPPCPGASPCLKRSLAWMSALHATFTEPWGLTEMLRPARLSTSTPLRHLPRASTLLSGSQVGVDLGLCLDKGSVLPPPL